MRAYVTGTPTIEVENDELILSFNDGKVEIEDFDIQVFTRNLMAIYRYEAFKDAKTDRREYPDQVADDALADLLVHVCITDVFEEYETRIKALKERVEELEMDVVCLATEY